MVARHRNAVRQLQELGKSSGFSEGYFFEREEHGKSEMALLYLVFVSVAQVWAAAAGGKSGEELK